jgi:hypothetical protein
LSEQAVSRLYNWKFEQAVKHLDDETPVSR